MFSTKKILIIFVELVFMLGIASGVTAAELPDHLSVQTNQFHRIEQPLELKVVVTLGGFALIGLELWWFLLSKTKVHQAESRKGVQD